MDQIHRDSSHLFHVSAPAFCLADFTPDIPAGPVLSGSVPHPDIFRPDSWPFQVHVQVVAAVLG